MFWISNSEDLAELEAPPQQARPALPSRMLLRSFEAAKHLLGRVFTGLSKIYNRSRHWAGASPNKDELSWLAELPLDVKVHIIMYAARAAGRPVLGMAVNRLCRKTMLLQQPGLIKKASCLPSALKLLLTTELKYRQQPLYLVVTPGYQSLKPASSSTLPETTSIGFVMVTKLTLYRLGTRIQQSDLQHFPMLEDLTLDECDIASIDISALANLNSFNCMACKVGNIIASGQAALQTMTVDNCKVTDASIQNCKQLEDVEFLRSTVDNKLTVHGCPRLEDVDCRKSTLSTLEITHCDKLSHLRLSWSRVTGSLQISECSSLVELCLLHAKVAGLETFRLQSLKELQCGSCSWLVDLHLPPSLIKLDCSKCYNLTTINASDCSTLKELNCRECTSLQQLIVPNQQQLKSLDCGGCDDLETLDVSNCQQLRTLKFDWCSGLQVLDVSNCLQLKNLSCKGFTNLEQLNVSNCQQLKNLDCTNCASLTVLDLSFTPQLAMLVCHGCDYLKVMNLPTSLLSLHCYPCMDMTELLNNVPPGLRCLGIQYSTKWRDLLPACPSLKELKLHSSGYIKQSVIGSTAVTVGPSLRGLCRCDTCRKCMPRVTAGCRKRIR